MLKVGECKALARRTLLGRYSTVICAYFITIGITFLMWALTIAAGGATLFGAGVFGSMFGGTVAFSFPKVVGGVILTMFLMIAAIIVSLWFEIGSTRLMLNICHGRQYGVGDVFYGFKKGSNTLRFVAIGIVLGLVYGVVNSIQRLLFLLAELIFKDNGTLLIIAVVVISIVTLLITWYIAVSFMLAKIIIADQRETGIGRALSTSRKLMKGRMLKGFWLMYLSFFFWYVLMFACGIAALWIAPYIACTTIIFYMDADGTLWQLTDAGRHDAEGAQTEATQNAEPQAVGYQTVEPQADGAETGAYVDAATSSTVGAEAASDTSVDTDATMVVAEGSGIETVTDSSVDANSDVNVDEGGITEASAAMGANDTTATKSNTETTATLDTAAADVVSDSDASAESITDTNTSTNTSTDERAGD